MASFFSELKRRNVYKVAAAYAVVAWLLIQAASIVFPAFEAPSWALKVVIAVSAIGFPIALVIAWAFEMTPEGMKRTADVSPEEKLPQWSRRKFAALIAGVALVAGGLLVFQLVVRSARDDGSGRSRTASLPITDKSIAVLPFENLSEDKANSYFVDGIQDEVITRLAKIGELRVISRTSTQRYKARTTNLTEIARELGVSHLVEGTVQRVGDRVRINVQLIRAANEGHLWAEIYDRNLTDIFSVQTELATAIAHSLQARLTGREQQVLAEKPTVNMAAYDAYLRGLDFASRPGANPADYRKAAEAFEEAVRLDPKFAEAWARLARSSAVLAFMQIDATPAREEKARVAVETATQLAPGSPETLLANAYYRYHLKHDYAGARELFEKIRRELPSNTEAVEALAKIARRQSRWKDAIRLFEEAAKLNPRDARLFMERAWTFSMVRDYPSTLEMLERTAAIAPDDADVVENKAYYFQWMGNLGAARPLIEQINRRTKTDLEIWQFVYERRFPEAIHILEEKLGKAASGEPGDRATILESLGSVHWLNGEMEAARQMFLEAKPIFEKLGGEQPKNYWLQVGLASVEAGLGNKEAARQAIARALEGAAASDDPVFAPGAEESVARIEAQLGDAEVAIARLERLLVLPYGAFPLTLSKLRIDPVWDPIRSHPRFKALMEGPEPKTVYE
jgi:TolB-like protein/tetratricopeptide (TPR) repeat protein